MRGGWSAQGLHINTRLLDAGKPDRKFNFLISLILYWPSSANFGKEEKVGQRKGCTISQFTVIKSITNLRLALTKPSSKTVLALSIAGHRFISAQQLDLFTQRFCFSSLTHSVPNIKSSRKWIYSSESIHSFITKYFALSRNWIVFKNSLHSRYSVEVAIWTFQ